MYPQIKLHWKRTSTYSFPTNHATQSYRLIGSDFWVSESVYSFGSSLKFHDVTEYFLSVFLSRLKKVTVSHYRTQNLGNRELKTLLIQTQQKEVNKYIAK